MFIVMQTASRSEALDRYSACAILDVSTSLQAWIRLRAEKALALSDALGTACTVLLAFPFALDIFTAMPEEADRLAIEEGALDEGWCEGTTAILDDIRGEPESLDYCELEIDLDGPASSQRSTLLRWVFRLRHSEVEEVTYGLSVEALLAITPDEASTEGSSA